MSLITVFSNICVIRLFPKSSSSFTRPPPLCPVLPPHSGWFPAIPHCLFPSWVLLPSLLLPTPIKSLLKTPEATAEELPLVSLFWDCPFTNLTTSSFLFKPSPQCGAFHKDWNCFNVGINALIFVCVCVHKKKISLIYPHNWLFDSL